MCVCRQVYLLDGCEHLQKRKKERKKEGWGMLGESGCRWALHHLLLLWSLAHATVACTFHGRRQLVCKHLSSVVVKLQKVRLKELQKAAKVHHQGNSYALVQSVCFKR